MCIPRPPDKVWPEGMQDCVFAFSDRSEDETISSTSNEGTWQERWPAVMAIDHVWEGKQNNENGSLLFLCFP